MKRIKTERGQSLVELSISLVLLLLLLTGAVEFGIAFFQFVQLRDAAQEGALYGSMNPTDTTGITSRVQYASNSPINLTTFTQHCSSGNRICITYEDVSHQCEGYGITVELVYNHQIFMPFLSTLLNRSTLPLKATVTDTILTPVCP